ncbi:hypothetical protein XENOCAPTIV_004550 [Xenoophorus captivus]|uniref:Uncharacterized protein n=1 Tax=Xenoophorus captivus TaxID=1517983 RepID=A0ABV0QYH3_9TELE
MKGYRLTVLMYQDQSLGYGKRNSRSSVFRIVPKFKKEKAAKKMSPQSGRDHTVTFPLSRQNTYCPLRMLKTCMTAPPSCTHPKSHLKPNALFLPTVNLFIFPPFPPTAATAFFLILCLFFLSYP